ncbi:MAG: hypothetical protein U0R49_11225 [Fimbriimonadales bacterium]
MERTEGTMPVINRMQMIGGVVGIAGLAAFFVGMSSKASPHPWQSYLFGFVVAMALTLGCLGLSVLLHMTRGKWGYSFIRFVEAGSKMVLPMAVLFIPLFMFASDIYPWANPDTVATSTTLTHRANWVNPQMFLIRSAIFFVVWIALAFTLAKWSKDEDSSGDSKYVIKRTNLAAPGAVLFVVTVNFAVTDWIMSLESHWYSTIFGLLFVAGGALFALAVSTTYLASVHTKEPYSGFVVPKNFHDAGNLMFTLVVFWAYLAFSQFLIIWSGNLPEEISYYADRKEGAWSAFGTAVVFLHFLLPFLLLLSKRLKSSANMLKSVALWIIVIRIGELAWEVIPSFHREGQQFHWMDAAAAIGMLGIWFAVATQFLKMGTLVPRYLNHQQEAAEHA